MLRTFDLLAMFRFFFPCYIHIRVLCKRNTFQFATLPGRKIPIEKKKALQDEIAEHINTLNKQVFVEDFSLKLLAVDIDDKNV